MIDIDYRGQDMVVETNRWRWHDEIVSMSANVLALDGPRSLEKKTRENYEGTVCVLSDLTCDPQSTHIGYERLFWYLTLCAESPGTPWRAVNGTEHVRSCRDCRSVPEAPSTSSSK